MGLQLIAQIEAEAALRKLLGPDAERVEVFQIEGELWGISIPTKLVDERGETFFRKRLSAASIYDLWEGKWHYAEPL